MTDASDAARVKLMGFDIDGVMTDGKLYYASDGSELKAFNVLDGFGINMLLESGIEVVIITGRQSAAVEARADNLGVRYLFQGVSDKQKKMAELIASLALGWSQTGFMGDDWIDLPLLVACGFAAAPASADQRVRATTVNRGGLVCKATGGNGAVREVCEHILDCQGLLQKYLQKYPCKLSGDNP